MTVRTEVCTECATAGVVCTTSTSTSRGRGGALQLAHERGGAGGVRPVVGGGPAAADGCPLVAIAAARTWVSYAICHCKKSTHTF